MGILVGKNLKYVHLFIAKIHFEHVSDINSLSPLSYLFFYMLHIHCISTSGIGGWDLRNRYHGTYDSCRKATRCSTLPWYYVHDAGILGQGFSIWRGECEVMYRLPSWQSQINWWPSSMDYEISGFGKWEQLECTSKGVLSAMGRPKQGAYYM